MPAVARCAPRRLSAFVASHASVGLVRRAPAAPRATCLSQAASAWTAAGPLALRDGATYFRSPRARPAVCGAAAPRMTASTPSPPTADGEPTDPVGEGDPATDGDTVLVHYVGCLDDGTVFDSSRTRGEPLTFTIGAGSVIPGFDAGVRGLRPGGKRTTRIEADQAYGRRNEELLVKVPLESCPDGLKAGDVVRLSNGATATVDSVADGVATIDANHRLAGLALTFEMELVGYQQLLLGPPPAGQERFIGAAGCFWGVELAFQRHPGVTATKVGYTGGHVERPVYESVGTSGHAEAVAADYDPAVTSYSALVDLFFERLGASATTLNKAGGDEGPQYRSALYVDGPAQRATAEAAVAAASARLGTKVVTEVTDAVPFWLAEEVHQKYLEKRGQSAATGETETIRCYG